MRDYQFIIVTFKFGHAYKPKYHPPTKLRWWTAGVKGEGREDTVLKIQPVCIVLAGFPGNHWEQRAPGWHKVRTRAPGRAGAFLPGLSMLGTRLCQGWRHRAGLTFQQAWVASSAQPSLSASQPQTRLRWGPPRNHKAPY